VHDGSKPGLTLESYAEILAEISVGRTREEVLEARGLAEEAFADEEQAYEDALSKALEDDGDEVPQALVRFEAAFRSARERIEAPSIMPLSTYAAATRIVQAGTDVLGGLGRIGVTFSEFARSTAHYGPRLAREPALAQEFTRLLGMRRIAR
jgi:hypothetical protein